MTNNISYNPEEDGITHINIYSGSKTKLGKLLSHFSHTPFVHPYFGPFASMEGFWYYLKAEKKDEKLRQLYGSNAKFYGKKLKSVYVRDFEQLVVDANRLKINQNLNIKEMMLVSELPFDHYYLFGHTHENPKKVKIAGFEWLVDGFEQIREEIKSGDVPQPLDYETLLR